MATPPPVSTIRPNVCDSFSILNLIFFLQDPLLSNDDGQIDDDISNTSSLLHSAERLVAPIQTPLPAGTPVQEQPTGGFTSTFNSANPTFTVLKSTVLQQVIGHPMAYARVLMQV